MTDKQLLRTATDFRAGILGDLPSRGMCFAVSAALQGYLSATNIVHTRLIRGCVNVNKDPYQHDWLALPDGRILDPTADQFKQPDGSPMPEVYIGKQPEWYKVATK